MEQLFILENLLSLALLIIYEVLGLFILLVIGIMLMPESDHLTQMELLGKHITPMSKTTFYFVITLLVLTDLVQTRCKKKMMAVKLSQVSR